MTCFFLILRLNDWQAVADKAAERIQSETKAINELIGSYAAREERRSSNKFKKSSGS